MLAQCYIVVWLANIAMRIGEQTMQTTRVWDLPTRLFHWALAVCFVALVITGQTGVFDWHFRLGYSVLTLLLFRLVWGFVGGHWSRFSSFVYHPSTILRYLRGEGQTLHNIGHNPLGFLSVLALLGFSLLQVFTGLFSDDEIASSGPLTKFVSGRWVELASNYHADIGKVILIVLVLLHIAAIVFYRVKKGQNLVAPMLHGDKEVPESAPASRDDAGSRTLALIIFLACAGLVAGMVRWTA